MERKKAITESPRIYTPAEMGTLIDTKTIMLNGSFLEDVLMRTPLKVGKATEVICPFCKRGNLKLNRIEPQYSGGPSPTPTTLHRTGDTYEFSCSGLDCAGRFSGTYTWMYID